MSRFLRSENTEGSLLVLDLEAVTAYHGTRWRDRPMTLVYNGAIGYVVTMTFEEFDKAFIAYQQAKIFQGYPGIPTPPQPFTPTEPYAPTETSNTAIWEGKSDTSTTIRLNKPATKKKHKKG